MSSPRWQVLRLSDAALPERGDVPPSPHLSTVLRFSRPESAFTPLWVVHRTPSAVMLGHSTQPCLPWQATRRGLCSVTVLCNFTLYRYYYCIQSHTVIGRYSSKHLHSSLYRSIIFLVRFLSGFSRWSLVLLPAVLLPAMARRHGLLSVTCRTAFTFCRLSSCRILSVIRSALACFGCAALALRI